MFPLFIWGLTMVDMAITVSHLYNYIKELTKNIEFDTICFDEVFKNTKNFWPTLRIPLESPNLCEWPVINGLLLYSMSHYFACNLSWKSSHYIRILGSFVINTTCRKIEPILILFFCLLLVFLNFYQDLQGCPVGLLYLIKRVLLLTLWFLVVFQEKQSRQTHL